MHSLSSDHSASSLSSFFSRFTNIWICPLWVSYYLSKFWILVSISASPPSAFFTFYLLYSAYLYLFPNNTFIFFIVFLYYSSTKCALVRIILCSYSFPFMTERVAWIFYFCTSAFSIFSLVYELTFLKLFIISIFCLRVVIWISTYIYFFLSWASQSDSVVAVWGSSLLISCFNLLLPFILRLIFTILLYLEFASCFIFILNYFDPVLKLFDHSFSLFLFFFLDVFGTVQNISIFVLEPFMQSFSHFQLCCCFVFFLLI